MANFEIKDGDFALFLNDKKGVEKRPDWRGYVQIAGKKYNVAAWNKTNRAGQHYLSGQASEEQKQAQ